MLADEDQKPVQISGIPMPRKADAEPDWESLRSVQEAGVSQSVPA
jgi:hypothetical protein